METNSTLSFMLKDRKFLNIKINGRNNIKKMTGIEVKISECIQPIITNLGYELYDVIYEKEGRDNYLRIYIDSSQGISLNDCENVNNNITEVLDEKDFIKSQYFLEVSSTGVEKRLRSDEQLEKNIGNKIEVHTYKAIENMKVLIGILRNNSSQDITLELVENQTDKSKTEKSKEKKKKSKSNENNVLPQNEDKLLVKTDNSEVTNIIKINKSNISNMKTVFNWEEM